MPKYPKPLPIEAILRTFAATGNLEQSCTLNKISPQTLRNRRKQDPALDALIRTTLHAQSPTTA